MDPSLKLIRQTEDLANALYGTVAHFSANRPVYSPRQIRQEARDAVGSSRLLTEYLEQIAGKVDASLLVSPKSVVIKHNRLGEFRTGWFIVESAIDPAEGMVPYSYQLPLVRVESDLAVVDAWHVCDLHDISNAALSGSPWLLGRVGPGAGSEKEAWEKYLQELQEQDEDMEHYVRERRAASTQMKLTAVASLSAFS